MTTRSRSPGARFTGAKFTGAKFTGAKFTGPPEIQTPPGSAKVVQMTSESLAFN
jgi:uncharacterized protein YjbI with pentapeptide repeats